MTRAKQGRFDGYIRVSRVGGREGDSFISPAEQRQKILDLAKLRGVKIDQFHEDLDQTGGKLDRPGLDALMARIRSGEVSGVAVARLDRLSRAGVADALRLVEEIHDCGASLAAVDLGIDPTTTFGEFALTIMLALARMERRRLAEGWDSAQRRAVDRGVHFGGRGVPFGYRRENGHPLQIVPALVPVVNGIFERRADRKSVWQITDWLNTSHPREDGRRWVEGQVERIIKNRVYLGEAFHGDYRNTEAHHPIVKPSLFAAANAVKGGSGRSPRDAPALLGNGLLRCAGCRYVMQVGKDTRTGAETYRCRRYHGGGDCTEPATIMAHKIEPALLAQVLVFAGSRSWEESGPDTEALVALESELEYAEQRRSNFLADDELRERISRDAYLAEADRREREVEEARARVEAEREAVGTAEHRRHVLIEDWLEWDTAERAEALRQTLDSVYVKRGRGSVLDRMVIYAAGTDDLDKPVRGGTEYVTEPIPWPEPPDDYDPDPDYEPPLPRKAKSTSVDRDLLLVALAEYPPEAVAEALDVPVEVVAAANS